MIIYKNLKNKKLHYFLCTFYIMFCFVVAGVFYFIFDLGNIDHLSLDSIRDNITSTVSEKKIILYLLLFILSFFWLLFLGFVSPLLLVAGYILNPYLAAMIISASNALAGSILIATFRNFKINLMFFQDSQNYKKIINFINKNILFYFFIFRLCAGFGIPSQIQNLIPLFTNINIINYFIISLFGCLPIFYISCKIGDLMNYLSFEEAYNFGEIFFNILIVSIVLIVIFIIKKYFDKKILKN